jgi:ribonuclease-3
MSRYAELLALVQERIGFRFDSPELLLQALTHSSFANENDTLMENNERLEFLGDAVLELCVSEELFSRFPEAREGQLTGLRAKLVSEPTLAELARRLKLPDCLLLGKGEEHQGGRDRDAVLCDCLESIIGAAFLDQGFAEARQLVLRLFSDLWPRQAVKPRSRDFKSRLQEMTQKQFKERPVYRLMGSSGPEHAKTYTVELTLPDDTVFSAAASSVKKAEQMAAKQALSQEWPDQTDTTER